MSLSIGSKGNGAEVITEPITLPFNNVAGDVFFACCHIRDTTPATVSSATYNGVALTLAGGVADIFRARVEVWYWDTAAHGAVPTGTHDVVFNLTGDADALVSVITLIGGNQTTPNDVAMATATGSDASPTVNITPITDGSWVLAFLTATFDGGISIGANQNQNYDITFSTTNGEVSGSNRNTATSPATTVTMNWSLTAGAMNWAIVSVAVKPAGAGTTLHIGSMLTMFR